MKLREQLACKLCGSAFSVKPYRKTTAKFCSVKCRQTGNGRRNTGEALRFTGAGKTYLKLGGQHMHRVVAEQKLGRKLSKGEIVHHIDGNNRNNESENLLITTQSEHCKLHHFGGKNQK